MEKIWQAKLEVNLQNIKHNINEIKKYMGNNVEIMPIIKDNAYGTEINKNIEFLEEANMQIVGVAIVDEGISMRKLGYKGDIFILNQPYEEDIPYISEYNLIVGIGSIDFLEKLGTRKEHFKIHIEIGTGMGRTGIHPDRVDEYLERLKEYSNIEVDGIYTHFSCSDCDEKYTKLQIKSFNKAVEKIKQIYPNIRYIHCCNSAGILNFKEAWNNLVRPGLILYGYLPTEELANKIDLKPSIRLKSKISFLKEVKEGTSISYGRSYITKRQTKVATIPLGYADGIRRTMSNRGEIVVHGKKASIIGKVCMDCFMVDVTEIDNVKVGDEVFIWDNEIIRVEDIAKIYDTINYEVISTISSRVVREYI